MKMKTFVWFSAFLTCALLPGCGGSASYSPSPAPMAGTGGHPANDTMRVGDKITIRLTGVPDTGYFNEIQIPASGDVTVDLLTQSFHAAGLTPAELSAEITDAYKSQKIYTNPKVTVLAEERYVNVGGDVRNPTRVLYT